LPARGFDDFETERVADAGAEIRRVPVFEIERDFTGHRKGAQAQAKIDIGADDGTGIVHRQCEARHERRLQDRKNRIGGERIENAACGIEGEGLRLAEIEQTRNMINIAVSQSDGLDRAGAHGIVAARRKRRRRRDLRAQIGRGVEENPIAPIAGNSQRGLGARSISALAGTDGR